MNGAYNVSDWFDGTQQTFPKLMQQAGYQTALVGKWHLASDPTGFDYWNILVGQGPYYNPPMIENGKQDQAHRLHDRHHHRRLARLAEDKRNPNKPFILMYQHKSPHRPWEPDPKHFDDVRR